MTILLLIEAQHRNELWTVKRLQSEALPDRPTNTRGEGSPLEVTRSLYDFDFPCEWRTGWTDRGEQTGIFTVEPIAIRFDVVVALEMLTGALRSAVRLEREAARTGWAIPEGARVCGEVLVVGEDRYVLRFLFAILAELPDGALDGSVSTMLLTRQGVRAPCALAPTAEGAPYAFAVRRDGVVVAVDGAGHTNILSVLPTVPLVPAAAPVFTTITCEACGWPHADRSTCP